MPLERTTTQRKPLLVGEANPWQTDERMAMRYALHPDPPHASGGRLCFKIMGLDEATYLRAFDRIDLCHPRWSIVKARERAHQIILEQRPVVVLCGRKVADAFEAFVDPFTVIPAGWSPAVWGQTALVVLPHPSGLNRLWHQPDAFQRARDALTKAGVLPVLSGAEVASS
jgi:hypothetical protein